MSLSNLLVLGRLILDPVQCPSIVDTAFRPSVVFCCVLCGYYCAKKSCYANVTRKEKPKETNANGRRGLLTSDQWKRTPWSMLKK